VKSARPVITLSEDADSDVAVVGGGISGVASSYFLLRDTNLSVILMEKSRIAHGATGHNGGQAVAAFEHTMQELCERFGEDLACAGQKAINSAWGLLYSIIEESGIDGGLQEVTAYLALSSIEDVLLMLRERQLMDRLGLPKEAMLLAEDVAAAIPKEYQSLFKSVPRRELDELLLTRDGNYLCTLASRMGLINSALFCEELVSWMLKRHPGRFRVYENTPVKSITFGSRAGGSSGNGPGCSAVLQTGKNVVNAKHTILCTNGYGDLEIEGADASIKAAVRGVVGFMIGYMNEKERPPAASVYFSSGRSGPSDAYYYLARRRYVDGLKKELISAGGPDRPLGKGERYDPEGMPMLGEYYSRIEDFCRKTTTDTAGASGDTQRDFSWNGLMGYTSSGVRVIGPDPACPSLIYNIGCNGIGILPSIYAGKRVVQAIMGEMLAPSVFDPASVSLRATAKPIICKYST
jgi:glycine/D-amino acid oxidase-like deaminating enzyme